MNKNNNMMYLEECITNIQSRIDISSNLSAIKRTIKREFDLECTDIIITETTYGDKFFGMRVYPTVEVLGKISDYILANNVKEPIAINKFVLEIDSKLLNDKALNAKPSEVVAVLLHEIGHISINAADIQKKLKYIIQVEAYKKGIGGDGLFHKFQYLKTMTFLYLIDGISNNSLLLQKEEISCDKFVIDKGYGEDLKNIIERILKLSMDNTKDQLSKDSDMKALSYWTIDNMANFNKRKNEIIKELKLESDSTKSDYIKGIVTGITDTIKKFNDKVFMAESMELQYKIDERVKKDILSEGFFSDLFVNNKINLTGRDLDELRIDVERVEDYDDKMVVMNKIYKRIFQCDEGMKLAVNNNDKEMKNIFIAYKNDLNNILKDLMNKKIVEKKFGVFVKYPKGYEG